MEYIKILVATFLRERNFLQAMNLCQDIINAEDKENKVLQKKLNWIKQNTTKKLKIPFHVVETYVSKYSMKPLTFAVEVPINTEKNRTMYKEFEMLELIINMKEAYEGMREIVTEIAKKYSISIPMQSSSASFDIPVIE